MAEQTLGGVVRRQALLRDTKESYGEPRSVFLILVGRLVKGKAMQVQA